jgi:hypothetical protein
MIKMILTLVLFFSLSIPRTAHAFWGDGGAGWANAAYLAQILAESIKQYQQLKMMLEQTKNSDQYFSLINEGLENSIGLLNALPIKDEKILDELRNFQGAMNTVEEIYGKIPKSSEGKLQLLHDQTVAESIRMVGQIKEYSRLQEENANKIAIQSRGASPKGAARMNAESNAQILHTLNQLLRVNGQLLKLHSEGLAMDNKFEKDSVEGHNKIAKDMKSGLSNFKGDFNLPRF